MSNACCYISFVWLGPKILEVSCPWQFCTAEILNNEFIRCREVEQSCYVHHLQLYYGMITLLSMLWGLHSYWQWLWFSNCLSTVAILVQLSFCSLSPCNSWDGHYSTILWIPSMWSFVQLLEAEFWGKFWKRFLRQHRKSRLRSFNLWSTTVLLCIFEMKVRLNELALYLVQWQLLPESLRIRSAWVSKISQEIFL